MLHSRSTQIKASENHWKINKDDSCACHPVSFSMRYTHTETQGYVVDKSLDKGQNRMETGDDSVSCCVSTWGRSGCSQCACFYSFKVITVVLGSAKPKGYIDGAPGRPVLVENAGNKNGWIPAEEQLTAAGLLQYITFPFAPFQSVGC